MEQLHALIVDDDDGIRKLLSKFLQKNNFQVSQAINTQTAEEIIEKNSPDVLLLDIMMPGEDGITFCRRIRESFNKPIIMLTAVDDDVEQIVAHEVGADDYLTKPYNMRVLLAKMKSVLRRYQISEQINNDLQSGDIETALAYQFSGWQLNTGNRIFSDPNGNTIKLSSAEYTLLVAFLEHPKRVLNRDQLLDLTQGDNVDSFDRSVDVLISRLRKKIETNSRKPEFIKTIRDGGYMLDCKVNKYDTPLHGA